MRDWAASVIARDNATLGSWCNPNPPKVTSSVAEVSSAAKQ
ncbi:Uncharacterised protein [Mycobacterium tuberculosis]|uniref:Uncharacterized protein n=1 Tax=Mycobacterium tuberculosis TaxID=1773 RepID=A0A0U0QYM4_MYCTX|nr:Uncharacterised protein [Mycobacterium tuberculosis]COV57694.1 Uncharacterised protein [Mycobacterium tuberculosis]COV87108.1 Uncharacterised protein [Mycobacterium tuberculosis]